MPGSEMAQSDCWVRIIELDTVDGDKHRRWPGCAHFHLDAPRIGAVPLPSLQLWEGKPNSKTYPHSLLHVCCSPASAKGRSGTSSRLQAASHDPRRTSKGLQMGDTEGDPGPVQAGQRLPLPAWAFFPLANHYARLRSEYSRKQRTEQTTGGHEEGRGRGFYSPEGFPFPVTR